MHELQKNIMPNAL